MSEFVGILIETGPANRPVMSKPHPFKAARVFVDRIMTEFDVPDREQAEVMADWIVNFAERYGAYQAAPVFDMDGNGPQCSWCGAIWPLCGHHHMTGRDLEEGGDDDE